MFDTPIAEAGLSALAAGAANAGLRPVLVHQRLDFMLYSLDQVVNWMAPWRFMSGGRAKMPVTIRAIIGKGWGQGPQHTKSLHTWFAHVPGLQVVMPASPSDAKGLLLSSIMSDDPTVFIEGRSLFSMQEDVPDAPYFIRLGEALVRREGKDVTLVTMGSMVPLALQAADALAKAGIDAEVVDLRCLMPLDMASVIRLGEEDRPSGRGGARLAHVRGGGRDHRRGGRDAGGDAQPASARGMAAKRRADEQQARGAVLSHERGHRRSLPRKRDRDLSEEHRRSVRISRNRRCVFLSHICPSSSLIRNRSSRACEK